MLVERRYRVLDIIYQSSILISIIVLGYVVKNIGIFSKIEDFDTLTNVILYITLPSAIITNLNGLEFPPILLVISIFGFLCNWLYLFISKRVGDDKDEQSFMMLSINGYNIGNFALPFIAFFLEGIPILAISLFDAGSSIMVLGGNYAIAKGTKKKSSRFDIPDLLRTVVKSPTVVVYILMVILSLLTIELPAVVMDIIQIPANANTFLAMFFIGIALEFNFELENMKKMLKYILARYLPAFGLVTIILLTPFIPTEIQYALALLLVAPVSGSAPIFTGRLDNNVEMSAQINSFSIIISILLMSVFLVYLGV